MSKLSRNDDYSRKQSLKIVDESHKLEREVRRNVWLAAAIVGLLGLFFGLFLVTQQLQSGSAASVKNPEMFIIPATGTSLSTVFGALLAVILAVWFSPTTFRLGKHESPETIARELYTRVVVRGLAYVCTIASIAVGAWAVLSSVIATGPQRIDIVRAIGAALVALGLAWWAAAAEARIGAVQHPRVVWAQRQREVKRLRQLLKRERKSRLSNRARVIQRIIAFIAVPAAAWGLGLLIIPAPSAGALIARLLTTLAVSFVAYGALQYFVAFVLARQIGQAVSLTLVLALFGLLLALAASVSDIEASGNTDAWDLAIPGRAVLTFSVVTLTLPFALMGLLTFPRLLGDRSGLIYDDTLRRFDTQLAKAEGRLEQAERGDLSDGLSDRKGRVAWASAAAFIPLLPFNVLFGIHALQRTSTGELKGRGWAVAGLVTSSLIVLAVLGALIWAAITHPLLVFCDPTSGALCIK